MTLKTPRKYVSEEEFGLAMLAHDCYPLEAVSCVKDEDDKGVYYIPVVDENSWTDQELMTGNRNGYANREQLMRCIGRCWDKGEAAEAKIIADGEARRKDAGLV